MVLMNHPHKSINSIKKTQPNKIVFYEKLEYILIYNLFNYITNKINRYKNSNWKIAIVLLSNCIVCINFSGEQQQKVLQILKLIPVLF